MITSFNSSLHLSPSAPTLSPSFWKNPSQKRDLAERTVSNFLMAPNSRLEKESEAKETSPKIKQTRPFLTYYFLNPMPKDRDLAVIQLARVALEHFKSSGQTHVIEYRGCFYMAHYPCRKRVSVIQMTGRGTSRLGGGTFGTVYQTTELVSQTALAMKIPNPNFSRKLFKREYDITKQIRDKDQFLLFFSVPFSTKRFIFFTQSLQDQDLFTFLNAAAPQSLSWADRLQGCRQLLLDYFNIYDKGVCHTDLKPENVLIRKKKKGELDLQIGDFGSAISHQYRPEKMEVAYNGYESMQDAYSLEEASTQKQFDAFFRRCRRRDMFALGVTLLELLIGRTLPLQAQKEWISDNRKKGILVSALKLFEQTAPPLYQPISPLLLEMTLMNPYLRPSWEDLRTRSNLLFSKFNTDKFYEEEICI